MSMRKGARYVLVIKRKDGKWYRRIGGKNGDGWEPMSGPEAITAAESLAEFAKTVDA